MKKIYFSLIKTAIMKSSSSFRSVIFFIVSSILSLQSVAQNDSTSVFGNKNFIPDGFEGKIYALPDTTHKLPDFDTMKSIGTIYAKEFNIPMRSWTEGFPGMADRFEWFGIEYKGYFKAKKKGQYIFRVVSDDGVKLFIDGKLLINNDGIHGPTSKLGEIKLDTSRHTMKLEYFQGPRTEIALQLFSTYQTENEEIFPGSNFTLTTPVTGSSFGTLLWIIIVIIILLFFFILIIIWRRRRKKPVTQQKA